MYNTILSSVFFYVLDIVRRVRASESHRSSSIMRASPPNSIWGIRLKKAPVVTPPSTIQRKRKDILIPTKNGKTLNINVSKKYLENEKNGIRLFTQPRKIEVDNYIGRKKTEKYVTVMLSMYDESDGPPNPCTVMVR